MLTKYHSSLFLLTMVSALSLLTTPALSSEPIASPPGSITLDRDTSAKLQCPPELVWRTMDLQYRLEAYKRVA